MNITAMYFSGTGTTKKVTAAIADELTEIKISQDETAADENPGSIKADIKPWQRAADIDFTPPAARREIYRFAPDDLVVFGVPVIAGRVPNVLLKFLDTLQGGGALAVPVVLYGNRNFDDALIELRNILQDRGFYMPHRSGGLLYRRALFFQDPGGRPSGQLRHGAVPGICPESLQAKSAGSARLGCVRPRPCRWTAPTRSARIINHRIETATTSIS